MSVRQYGSSFLDRVVQQTVGKLRLSSVKQFVSLFLVGASLSVAIASCSPGADTSSSPNAANSASPVANKGGDGQLTLVGYAIPKAAHDAIIPKFVEQWKKDHNQNVTFNQSYGGSGSQTRAIIDGLEADIAHLALAGDTNKLVKAGFVSPDWNKKVPNNGTVARSVAALIVREGNPKNIKSWDDLVRSDVKWVTADPKTSGGARWNFLALWDYVRKTGGDDAKAQDFVTKAYKNVAVLAKDARESTDAFYKQGQGDALMNYENEVILAQQKGEKLEYVVPEVNLSIDTPIAVIDKNVDKHGTREVAEAFVKFLFTPEAQEEFVKLGYRPLDEAGSKQKESANKFPAVKQLGKVDEYGGWNEVQTKFFEDGAVFDKIRG